MGIALRACRPLVLVFHLFNATTMPPAELEGRRFPFRLGYGVRALCDGPRLPDCGLSRSRLTHS